MAQQIKCFNNIINKIIKKCKKKKSLLNNIYKKRTNRKNKDKTN